MKKLRVILITIKVLFTDPLFGLSFCKNIFIILFLRTKLAITSKKLIVISLTEHLGDTVATEPIARFVKESSGNSYIIWVINKSYRPITKSNPVISKTISVTCFTEWILLKYFCNKKSIIDLHINDKVCDRHHFLNHKSNPFDITMGNYYEKGNLLYCFSRSGGLEIQDNIQPRLYLNNSFSLSGNKNYIVIQTSAHLPSRSPGDEFWNKTADLLLENTNMDIIEIGFPKKIKNINDRIIDFTGKKKLPDIAGLVNNCRLFIGIDSSFAHFANALKKNSLIFIGTQGKFRNYMPYSGWMQTRKDDMIIYYPGLLTEMPFEYVAGRIKSKLEQ